jgi:sigma-E factor negative regulatory protein RseA
MDKKMSRESHEHLSCLMDGEISRETSRFLVRRMGADEELCGAWARYHLVRDCLRHPEGGLVNENLCHRIHLALEEEQVAPAAPARRAWLKPLAGMAVAASVALVAVLTVSSGGPGQATETPGPALAQPFTSPQGLAPAPASRQVSLSGRSPGEQKMNAYLLRHYQATGATGGKGFVTFVPIVITSAPARANGGETEPADGSGAPTDNDPAKQ